MNELSSDLKIRHDFKIHNLCIKLKVNLEWLAAKREKDLWEREREREREWFNIWKIPMKSKFVTCWALMKKNLPLS